MAESEALDGRGFVVDFAELDPVKRWIDATLDHRHLNDVMEGQPSAEAIARLVFEWCERELPFDVAAIRVWETPRAYAEYRP
jgi:6-pyruvoyltetrahydropterin/6-carboxytetrahydropterin synthase